MKTDIENRTDIRQLVHKFYEHLLKDDTFRHIFLEVAAIDILPHLDIIIDFWESVLFQAGKYKGDTVQKLSGASWERTRKCFRYSQRTCSVLVSRILICS